MFFFGFEPTEARRRRRRRRSLAEAEADADVDADADADVESKSEKFYSNYFATAHLPPPASYHLPLSLCIDLSPMFGN